MSEPDAPRDVPDEQPGLWQTALAVAWPLIVLFAFVASAVVPALEYALGGR